MSGIQTIPNGWQPAHTATQETVITGMDKPLVSITVFLLIFGLVAVFTASANQAQLESGFSLAYVLKQAVAMVLGLVAMITLSRVNFQFWRKTGYLWAGVAIGLLLLTMLFGVTANGSERWIPLGFGIQLQASDPAKIAAIFLIAEAASLKPWYKPKLLLNGGLVALMILLIYQQPNLSVSIILTVMTAAMLFVGGVPWQMFIGLGPVGCYVLYHKIMDTEYQRRRIVGWLNPWGDPMDSGYNLIQSYYAIGSGGLLGVGLGHSIQKLYYLPFQHTDFIFSVICEELGFLGALIPIGLFTLLGWRGFTIALNCPNAFGRMLAFGITLALLLQALINICVTVGLMPVTGVTLPLISYGGTSVVTTLAMIGILLNVSRYRLNTRLD